MDRFNASTIMIWIIPTGPSACHCIKSQHKITSFTVVGVSPFLRPHQVKGLHPDLPGIGNIYTKKYLGSCIYIVYKYIFVYRNPNTYIYKNLNKNKYFGNVCQIKRGGAKIPGPDIPCLCISVSPCNFTPSALFPAVWFLSTLFTDFKYKYI